MNSEITTSSLAEKNALQVRLTACLIVLSTSLVLSASNIFMPSLLQIASSFGCNSNTLLISVSIFYMAFAISGLFFGAFADYFGHRIAMLAGFSLFITGSCICLFSGNYQAFMLGNLLEGIGAAAPVIVGLATIQNLYSPEDSVKTLGWMGALLSIMPSISPILGGYLAMGGWRTNYVFISTVSLVVFVLMYVFYTDNHKSNKEKSGLLFQLFASYWSVISHLGFLRYALLYPILVLGSTTFLTAMPLYLMQGLHYDSKMCGYLIGFMTIGYALGGLSTSKLVTKYGMQMTLRFGILLTLSSSALLILSFIATSKYMLFVIAAFIFQIGLAVVHPPSTTIAVRYFTNKRASASAVRGTFSILGSALGATIAAALNNFNISYIAGVTFIAALVASYLALMSSINEHH